MPEGDSPSRAARAEGSEVSVCSPMAQMPTASLVPSDRALFYAGDPWDRRLHVRNIPPDFDDWALFHVFRVLGRVHSVNLTPVKFDARDFHRFGFVDMLTLADADRVLESVAKSNGLFVPGLSRRLEVQRAEHKTHDGLSSAPSSVEGQLRSDSGVSLLGDDEKRYSQVPTVKYRKMVHRCDELPIRRIISNVSVRFVGEVDAKSKQRIFYMTLCPEEDTFKPFEDTLNEHYEKSRPMRNAEVNDLALMKDASIMHGNAVRVRVLSISSEGRFIVECLDSGIKASTSLNALRPISPALASLPFKAIPCALYGVSELADNYQEEEERALLAAVTADELRVRLITFRGAESLVQLWTVRKSSAEKPVVNDVAMQLANMSLCHYKRYSDERLSYSRDFLLSFKENCAPTPALARHLRCVKR